MKFKPIFSTVLVSFCLSLLVAGCARMKPAVYFNQNMDFSSLHTVAVMPFQSLTGDTNAAERVRNVFINMLLATQSVYVLPPGEVDRGIRLVGMVNSSSPSVEEIKKLAGILKVDAVITGELREYGEVRTGSSTANVISVGVRIIEAQAGNIVWSASSTKGGITVTDRLFGGGGEPMNTVTEEAINDLLNKLFK